MRRLTLHEAGFSSWEQKNLEELSSFYRMRLNPDILIFKDIQELSEYLGEELPSWVIGTNDSENVLVIEESSWPCKYTTMNQLLIHELAHLYTLKRYENSLFIDGFPPIPLWAFEGIAMFFSGQNLIYEGDAVPDLYRLDYGHPFFYEISSHLVRTIFLENWECIGRLSTYTYTQWMDEAKKIMEVVA